MAIDLICYCIQTPQEAHPLQKLCNEKLHSKFGKGLHMYDAELAEGPYVEIARDYGLAANSVFMLSFADKSLATAIRQIATTLIDTFGREKIIVLMNNESRIE